MTIARNPGADDASLVAQSLAGRRDAFAQIVARYQSLICSVACSGTGSLNESEDVAQDTFVTAWKELHTLREPVPPCVSSPPRSTFYPENLLLFIELN